MGHALMVGTESNKQNINIIKWFTLLQIPYLIFPYTSKPISNSVVTNKKQKLNRNISYQTNMCKVSKSQDWCISDILYTSTILSLVSFVKTLKQEYADALL